MELYSGPRPLFITFMRVFTVDAEAFGYMYDAENVDSDGVVADILDVDVVFVVTYLVFVVYAAIAIPVQLGAQRDAEIFAEFLFYQQWHRESHRIDARRKVAQIAFPLPYNDLVIHLGEHLVVTAQGVVAESQAQSG